MKKNRCTPDCALGSCASVFD
uniref:Uncharacterized protein n=1 Tax=Arundo donax TaxID=35708 RepID=A0A0A9AMS9_ARUDO